MVAHIILSRRLPLSLPWLDYRIPDELESKIKIGQLVKVPFRYQKAYGIVHHLTPAYRGDFKNLKSVEEIVNLSPALSQNQLSFLEEISVLYQTSLGFLVKNNLFSLQKTKVKIFQNEKGCGKNSTMSVSKPTAFFYSTADELGEYLKQNLLTHDQNLIIVPEINDLQNIANLLLPEIQEQIMTFHSDIAEKRYFECWLRIWNQEQHIIVGTRQALFLPWQNLKNIFLIKEGDPLHKNWDMAPRFHARDASLLLSTCHKAKLHLLDHTPSMETYYFSSKNIFSSAIKKVVPMAQDRTLLIHTSAQQPSLLHETVLEKLSDSKRVSFIFTPQRGSAHYIFCSDCNFVFVCPECGGNLTYHAKNNEIKCHNCKYQTLLFSTCAKCGGLSIRARGIGTESVEKELRKIFPEKEVIRLDSDDKTRKYLALPNQGIIIGTQFAWNKIEWRKIDLMAFVDIDSTLTIPEFKTNEHIWYSLRQAQYLLPEHAELCVQTRKPDHLVFSSLMRPEFFYEKELQERKKFFYPPFVFILKLYHGNQDKEQSEVAAQNLHSKLKNLTKNSQNITIMSPLSMKPLFRNKKYWIAIVVKISFASYKRDSKHILAHIPSEWKVDLNPNSLLSF